jgi:CBS domain-containing protein
MRVREIMSESLATCRRDSSLDEVARLMRDNDCGAIPVVNDREPVGVVTDRDIAIRCVAEGRDPQRTTAGDIMSSPVISVNPDDDAHDAVRTMENRQIRRIVVQENGTIVGIVAQADVARHMPERETGELVEEISEPGGPGGDRW